MNFTSISKNSRFKKLFNSQDYFKAAILYRIQRLLGHLFDLFFSFIEHTLGYLVSLDWRTTTKTSEDILVCRNQKYSLRSNEDSHEKFQIDDTLVKYGCKVINFYWDQGGFFGSQIKLWLLICVAKPKIIIFSSYRVKSWDSSHPSRLFIERIRKKKNTKIIFIWWDTCSDSFYDTHISYLKSIDSTHVLMENPMLDLSVKPDLDSKILGLYSTFVENELLYPRKKNIEVSFIGRLGNYRSYRREYIEFLMESNVSAYISVFEKENQVSNDKYFEILGRSKIVINFSFSVDKHQFKGRPIEVFHSGAMLLETYNKQTASLFRDGIDYVSFKDKYDMVDKIKYYSLHPEEAEKIAKSGRDRMLALYNLNVFWDKVFQANN